jgi:hypothetical protein
MIKKSVLALFGLIFAIALATPQKANAQVAFGIGVGPVGVNVGPGYYGPYPNCYYAPGYYYPNCAGYVAPYSVGGYYGGFYGHRGYYGGRGYYGRGERFEHGGYRGGYARGGNYAHAGNYGHAGGYGRGGYGGHGGGRR